MREREREGGAHGGVWAPGARRAGPDRAWLGWAGLGWAGPLRGSKTHDERGPLNGINRESKPGTERDEHSTSNKEMCFGMMQHP
jgi:hypothetical protein